MSDKIAPLTICHPSDENCHPSDDIKTSLGKKYIYTLIKQAWFTLLLQLALFPWFRTPQANDNNLNDKENYCNGSNCSTKLMRYAKYSIEIH